MSEIKYNQPDADYFATPAASNSTLSRMKKSPAHCKAYMEEPFEPTANMKLGTLVHTLVLEPGTFHDRYHVQLETDPTAPRSGTLPADVIAAMLSGEFDTNFYFHEGFAPRKPSGMAMEIAQRLIDGEGIDKYITEPAMNKRTAEGKEKFKKFQDKCEREGLTVCKQEHIDKGVEYADYILVINGRVVVDEISYLKATNYIDFLSAIDGKEVITPEQHELATDIAGSVLSKEKAAKLLSAGQAEVSIYWEDEETGYPCKGRIDFVSGAGALVDLKTTKDASLEEFKRSIANFGYHRQQAMYSDGYEAATGSRTPFVFIAVESKPPFAVGIYMLDDESEEKGRTEYKELLAEFKQCQESGEWPAYSEDIEMIELPKWYK